MHHIEVADDVIADVVKRRGSLHLFDELDTRRTALIVIDMQNAFVAPAARASKYPYRARSCPRSTVSPSRFALPAEPSSGRRWLLTTTEAGTSTSIAF